MSADKERKEKDVRARIRCPFTAAAAVMVAVAALSSPTLPQGRQPVPDEAAAQLVAAALLQYFDPASVFQVEVLGASIVGDSLRLDSVHIEGRPAVLHGFRATLVAQMARLELDASGIPSQEVRVRRIGHATVVVTATAQDVQAGLEALSPRLLHPRVSFGNGEFEVTATVKRGEKLYPAVARGSLRIVGGGQRLMVLVTRATVSEDSVPPHLVETELAKLNPVVDLSRWPLGLRIQRAVLSRGTVEFLATAGQ